MVLKDTSDDDFRKVIQRVKKEDGCLDDVVARFTDADPDSEEYRKVKQNVSARSSAIRSFLKKQCEKLQLPVSRVDVICPTFRDNRMTGKKEGLLELAALLNDVQGADEIEAEEPAE